ncbi:hypothetical protein UA3_02039 [Enterococcus faecium EnGen0263]|nr:hypothetical protein UA3_02039 [Enterococcus faecium EnGen0263]
MRKSQKKNKEIPYNLIYLIFVITMTVFYFILR